MGLAHKIEGTVTYQGRQIEYTTYQVASGTVFVFNIGGNQPKTMEFLKVQGLVPLEYNPEVRKNPLDFDIIIYQNNDLKKRLEGHFFWIKGKGYNDGELYMRDKDGNVIKGYLGSWSEKEAMYIT